MEYYKVLGISQFIEVKGDEESGEADCYSWTIFLSKKDDHYNVVYMANFSNWYGMCGSGYTSACSGSYTPIEHKPYNIPLTYHFKPISEMIVFEQKTEDEDGETYSLVDVSTNKALLSCNGDGGDNYYPCGGSYLDTTNLKANKRLKEKKQVYVFVGESGIGKTFLSSKLSLNVY